MDLQDIRKRIDHVDNQILELLESRMELSEEVAEYKKQNKMPIFDKSREEEKIDILKNKAKNDFNKEFIADLFTKIMSVSRSLQYNKLNNQYDLGFIKEEKLECNSKKRVAFYGEKGAYTEQAMIEYFGEDVTSLNSNTFEQVMSMVKDGEVDYGVLPIENSNTGTLSDVFDLLAEYNNYIIGEYLLKIEHHLLGLKDAKLENIKTVYSHKQGILQCSEFLKSNNISTIDGGSTSGSAKRVLEENDISKGAIASKRAASHYELNIIRSDINNEKTNTTRFIIISNKKNYFENSNKISLCFALPHEKGSLYNILSHFIYNGINMTKIESRPLLGKPFEYRFFVDVEGEISNNKMLNALHGIEHEALEMKILGVYKAINSNK